MKLFAVAAILSGILSITVDILEAQNKLNVVFFSFLLFLWIAGLIIFIAWYKVVPK